MPKIPILSVYDDQGNRIPIPAIKGKDGKDGVQINDSVPSATTTYSGTKIEELLGGISTLVGGGF